MKQKEIDELINTILYGDVHETPTSILGDKLPPTGVVLDEEQQLRVSIAATLKKKLSKGQVTS